MTNNDQQGPVQEKSYQDSVAEYVTPELYKVMKEAVELGKWPDGTALTQAHKEDCLQAIIMYDAMHCQDETERTGYLPTHPKNKNNQNNSQDQPVKWREDDDSQ